MGNLCEEFGKNLKQLRKSKFLTQEELGKMIGINQRQITRIERGRNFPSSSTLEKICFSLNITVQELFNFSINTSSLDLDGTYGLPTYHARMSSKIITLHLKSVSQMYKHKFEIYDKQKFKSEEFESQIKTIAQTQRKPITIILEANNAKQIIIYFPDGSTKQVNNPKSNP